MKTSEQVRQQGKERVTAINAGKHKDWTPMDRDNSLTYVGAFTEGYEAALADLAFENGRRASKRSQP
jgi:hypothetical protein